MPACRNWRGRRRAVGFCAAIGRRLDNGTPRSSGAQVGAERISGPPPNRVRTTRRETRSASGHCSPDSRSFAPAAEPLSEPLGGVDRLVG